MSIQMILTAMGDFSEVEVQQSIVEARNERINQALEETDKRAKEAFEAALGAMRASYMMVSGFAQIIGGSMGQIFSSMYAIAVSSIQLFSAIAQAEFFVPGMQMQSVMMMASLLTAITSLASVMTGQTELASRVSGLNMSLHGISEMIGAINF